MRLPVHSLHIPTTGGERHRNIIRDAERVKSMVYCHSTDLSDHNDLYTITVMFTDEADLMWFKLKWS